MAQTDKALELAEEHTVGGTILRGLFGEELPPEVLMLEPEDFSVLLHGHAWEAIRAIIDRGEAPDLVAVHAEFRSWEEPPPNGTIAALCNLVDEVPTSANLAHWAKAVLSASRYRGARRSVSNALHQSNHGGSADALAAGVLEAVDQLPSDTATELQPAKVAMSLAIKQLEERHKNRGQPFGLQTGFADLDELVCGLHPGDLAILAARPSMGKTSLALQIALQSFGAEGATLIFSAEMTQESLAQRMWAIDGSVNLHAIRSAGLSDVSMAKVTASCNRIKQRGIEITDRITSMRAIRGALRRYRSRKVKLVVVDYLQLLVGEGRSREEEVAKISRDLKAIAKELRCPVLALAQLNRAAEKDTDKRPQLSHLRESGGIEQDADVVAMIYREDYYETEPKEPGVAEILIRKNRNGPTGTAKLAWKAECTRFDNLEVRR